MKEKLLFIFLVLVLLLSMLIILFASYCNIYLFMIDLLIILYLYGFCIERRFIKLRVPNIMLSRRNYKNIIICDESYLKNINIDKENTLVLSNYNRNLYVDFLILKRFYSFLGNNGTCNFVFDFNNNRYFKHTKIDSLDYIFLHIVTLYENNINPKSLKYKVTKILNKYKVVFYRLGIYKLVRKKIDFVNVEQYIKEISRFLEERELNLRIYTKGIKELEQIQDRYKNIEFKKIEKEIKWIEKKH